MEKQSRAQGVMSAEFIDEAKALFEALAHVHTQSKAELSAQSGSEEEKEQQALYLLQEFCLQQKGHQQVSEQPISQQQQDAAELIMQVRYLYQQMSLGLVSSDEASSQAFKNRDSNALVNKLNYVVEVTENAANDTLDKAEDVLAKSKMIKNAKDDISALLSDCKLKAEATLGVEFVDGLEQGLATIKDANQLVHQGMTETMVVQNFQDLSGQVLKAVSSSVEDYRTQLFSINESSKKLAAVMGLLESELLVSKGLTNEAHLSDGALDESLSKQQGIQKDITAEGPIINAEARSDALGNQGEVDDLLSSLGL